MGTVQFQEHLQTMETVHNLINSIAKDSLGVDINSHMWHLAITADIDMAISAAINNPAGRWFWLKCALHILSNMVKAGLFTSGMIGSIVEKLQCFTNFLSSSNVARQHFDSMQQIMIGRCVGGCK